MKEHENDMGQSRHQAQGYGGVQPCLQHAGGQGPLARPGGVIVTLLGDRAGM